MHLNYVLNEMKKVRHTCATSVKKLSLKPCQMIFSNYKDLNGTTVYASIQEQKLP